MKMIRIICAILLPTLFTFEAFCGDVAVKEKDIASKCDEYMQARTKYSKFSGSVLMARDGKPLYEKGFGLANAEYDIPNTPQTKFRLASVSKQFAATAIMILEHEGKLKVDDPISKYVSSVPDAWSKVTLHQLLSHTSGVPENLSRALMKGMWPQPINKDNLFDHIKKLPLDFKPGEKWSYSNTGYALLGLTIEKVSGMDYGQFLKQRIFDPLDMKDTGVDDRKLVLKNRAHAYGMADGRLVQALHIDLSEVYSAGSLYSTVNDLLKWDNALYTEKILPQKSLERMWTPVKNNYGYGWLIVGAKHKVITHSGGLPGCVTVVSRYPNDKEYVAVLCNLEGSAAGQVARDLAAIGQGEPYDLPIVRQVVKVESRVLDEVAGDYEFKPSDKITIRHTNDELYAQKPGQGRFRIQPESETNFFARAEEIGISFWRGDDGRVTGLTLHQNGRDYQAKKLPPATEKKAADSEAKSDAAKKGGTTNQNGADKKPESTKKNPDHD
jgi:CubicO group peptidase (beta-lactamase class C family)